MSRTADHSHVRPGLGTRLRQARGGVTMRELGEAVGISGAYISRIEKDQRVPSLQLIHRFADHLGVSRAWLATGKTTDDHEDEVLALRRENDRLRRRLAEIKSLADETLFR